MQIEKYYFDVIHESGAGFIGYAAKVHSAGLSATVGSTLQWSADTTEPATQRRTIRASLPRVSGATFSWDCSPLDVEGTWRPRRSGPGETTLWRDGAMQVRWEVIAPVAEVDVLVGDDRIMGLGYAERLVLDLPRWRLPIDTLRWGRFVSAEHSVVWIDWAHAQPRRWLWHNARPVANAVVDGDCVQWPGHRLTFGPTHTLRSGRLVDTALRGWPAVNRWLPARLRAYEETKWCAPAMLERDDADAHGWAIYEVVHFR